MVKAKVQKKYSFSNTTSDIKQLGDTHIASQKT